MNQRTSEDLALAVVAGINDRDYGLINSLATENVQLRLPPAQVFYGREGVREFFAVLEARLPRLIVTARKIHAGDRFAVVEYETAGDVDGMGAIVLELDAGRVEGVTLYLDTAQWAEIGARR